GGRRGGVHAARRRGGDAADERDEDDRTDEDRKRAALLRTLRLARDRGIGNAVCAAPLRRELATHRTENRLYPLVVLGVEEPRLDRVNIVGRRRRFGRAATFLDPHLFDGIPGEDRSFLATHHIHHR